MIFKKYELCHWSLITHLRCRTFYRWGNRGWGPFLLLDAVGKMRNCDLFPTLSCSKACMFSTSSSSLPIRSFSTLAQLCILLCLALWGLFFSVTMSSSSPLCMLYPFFTMLCNKWANMKRPDPIPLPSRLCELSLLFNFSKSSLLMWRHWRFITYK